MVGLCTVSPNLLCFDGNYHYRCAQALSVEQGVLFGVFVPFTGILFIYFIRENRALWRRVAFWVMTAIFAVIHSYVFVLIMERIDAGKLFWIVVLTLAEALAFPVVKSFLFARRV